MRRALLTAALLLVVAPAVAGMQVRPLEWTVGGERFSGYLVHDDATDARRPGLVMVPNWMGVTDDALEHAKAVAGTEYVVLVADVYGKGRRPKDSAEAGKLAGSLRGEDRGPLRARMQAAVATLKAQAGGLLDRYSSRATRQVLEQARRDDFLFLKAMQEANRVIPVVGDLAGASALRDVGDEIRRRGLVVRVLYTSNVEYYLWGSGTFDSFVASQKGANSFFSARSGGRTR